MRCKQSQLLAGWSSRRRHRNPNRAWHAVSGLIGLLGHVMLGTFSGTQPITPPRRGRPR